MPIPHRPLAKKQSNKISYHEPDKSLIYSIVLIILFGLVSLSSASSIFSYTKYGDAYYLFKHQLFGMTLGFLAFWYFSRVDYHYWKKYAFTFLIVSIGLLLLVFIPALRPDWGHARSWIEIFGMSLQPSELVKISFLLYLAAWLEQRKDELHDVSQGIGPFVIILGLIAFLMLLQPDIGTLSIIAITSLIVYFVGGGSMKHILIIVMIAIIIFSIMIIIKPYQQDRFKCLFNPDYSKQDICYQTNQSLIAVATGGLWGRGIGESRQKYLYLPEVSSDSIFAVISEEIGLIFSSILIFIYFYIFYRGYLIAKYAPDDFGKILAIGIVSWVAIQAIINIGGIINILPMTGVPLPFISYGGSAILAAMVAVGILVNISKQTKIKFE
ncbi:putative lipid II flippase FtsW [Patescibacteria group bacterium]